MQRVKKKYIYIYNPTKMKFYIEDKLNFINVDLSRSSRYRDNGGTKKKCVHYTPRELNGVYNCRLSVDFQTDRSDLIFASLTRRKLDRVELADRRTRINIKARTKGGYNQELQTTRHNPWWIHGVLPFWRGKLAGLVRLFQNFFNKEFVAGNEASLSPWNNKSSQVILRRW